MVFAIFSVAKRFCWISLLLVLMPLAAVVQAQTVAAKTQDPAKELVKIVTADKFTLVGDYFAGKAKSGGVLLLHDCQGDRRVLDGLGQELNSQGLHVLSFDLRGYGASSNEQYSQQTLKKNSRDIVSYQNDIAFIASFWKKDVLTAFKFLLNKVDKSKQIAVVSSGCSVKYAIALADVMHLNSLVMLTPTLDFIEKENYKNLNEIATYFIDSTHQIDSYKTTQELFGWNGDNSSKMQVYNGDSFGYLLLRKDPALTSDIAQWLGHNLR